MQAWGSDREVEKVKPGDVRVRSDRGGLLVKSYEPADAVEYAICRRRGHDFQEQWISEPVRCRWCGVRVSNIRNAKSIRRW